MIHFPTTVLIWGIVWPLLYTAWRAVRRVLHRPARNESLYRLSYRGSLFLRQYYIYVYRLYIEIYYTGLSKKMDEI
jgi:hypothetical protein